MNTLSGRVLNLRKLLVRLCLTLLLAEGLLWGSAPYAFSDIETVDGPHLSEQAEGTVPVEPSTPDQTLDSADSSNFSETSGMGASVGAGTQNNAALQIALSEPVVSQGWDEVLYTSTLTVKDVDALFGYQLRVMAPTEDSVTIKNLVGGTATAPVYKEGSLYQAILLGEGLGGDVAICEITVRYAADSAQAERVLTVEQIQVVTDIRAETMLVLGPDPPAATVTLVPVEPLVAFVPWLFVVACLLAVALVVILIWRRSRARFRRSNQLRTRHPQTQRSHARHAHTQRQRG
jgi:hypothetical protein